MEEKGKSKLGAYAEWDGKGKEREGVQEEDERERRYKMESGRKGKNGTV